MLDTAAGDGRMGMPRTARVVIPGCVHHVTQRGNNRQDVFFVDADRQMFLQYLREAAERFALRVEGYCLMTNHIHLVVTPQREDSLAGALKRVNQLYAQYVNRLHGRSGHLWQNRFFSCPLDREHLWRALVYVERNPVRARLCRKAWQWQWSSAARPLRRGRSLGLAGHGRLGAGDGPRQMAADAGAARR